MARSRSPIDRVVGAIVPRAIGAVDPDEVLQRVDVDLLVERLDVQALIGRIDVDALVRRVDVDALIQRVDVDALIRRVDVDALVQRIDLDGLMQRVDVAGLVHRAEIDRVVAEATTGVASRTMDVARRKVSAVDTLLLGAVDRILRRRPVAPVESAPRAAGPLARTLGFLVDSVLVSTTFGLGVALGAALLELFTARDFDTSGSGGPLWTVAFGAWWLVYLWATIALSGRTVGKALLGLRVASPDGSLPTARAAAVRALVFPFSFVLGLGFVPAVVGRQRRALHELAAGTVQLVDPIPDRGER
jgi:uncharacterized RDD family membrane protein YckC